MNVVNKPIPKNEDEDFHLVNEPVLQSHSEVFAGFTKCIIWTEAQTDIDPVSVQLLRRLQQKAANMRTTKLKQYELTKFFS